MRLLLLVLGLSLPCPAARAEPLACGAKAVGTVLVLAPNPAEAQPWVELLREAGFSLSWDCPRDMVLIVHATEFSRRDGRSPLAVEVTEPSPGPAAKWRSAPSTSPRATRARTR